jgi:hypothetical protein
MENIATWIAILKPCCDQTNCCTGNDEKILNKIDHDITKILLHAERDCKRAKGHAWSSLLAHAGKMVIAAKWHLSDVCLGWESQYHPVPEPKCYSMLDNKSKRHTRPFEKSNKMQELFATNFLRIMLNTLLKLRI